MGIPVDDNLEGLTADSLNMSGAVCSVGNIRGAICLNDRVLTISGLTEPWSPAVPGG